MSKVIRTVAKITKALAIEIDAVFQDNKGNYVIRMEIAEELEPNEFTPIAVDCDVSLMPVVPGKSIIRPK